MPEPGDVVIVRFPGALVTKPRPAVVVSSRRYHEARPDCLLAIITSNTGAATASFDVVLGDWKTAGLARPSAVRAYFGMAIAETLQVVGRLSDRDFAAVAEAMSGVFAT